MRMDDEAASDIDMLVQPSELTAVEVGQRRKASGGSPKPDLNKPHLCALPTD